MRSALAQGWSLKPIDAIHLGTAIRLQVDAFHTYDRGLDKYAARAGFPIQEPIAAQPQLPGT
jgi:predicted nucleic acid-binding protein